MMQGLANSYLEETSRIALWKIHRGGFKLRAEPTHWSIIDAVHLHVLMKRCLESG